MDASIQQFRLTAVRVQETERPRTSNNEDLTGTRCCHRLRQAPKFERRSVFMLGVGECLRGVDICNGFQLLC